MDIKHNFLDAKLFKIAKMPVSAVRTATFFSFMPGKYDNQLGFFLITCLQENLIRSKIMTAGVLFFFVLGFSFIFVGEEM